MNRNTYVISYIASIIVSSLIGYFTSNAWLLILCLFVTRFVINFYYGHQLQVSTSPKIFSSIFSSIGFLFLMGYDKNIIGAWDIFISGLKVYKKNFWYLLTYIMVIILVNIVLGLIFGLLLEVTNSLLNNTTGTIIKTVIFALFIAATVIFNIVLYLASLKAVKEAYLGQTNYNDIMKNIKESYELFWTFIGGAVLKFIIANGPMVIGLLGFIIFSLSAMWTTYSTGTVSSSLLKPSVFNIITGIIIVYGIFHSLYFLLRLSFYVYGILFENKEAKNSLYYSMEMTKNKWWQILWRVFIPGILVALASIIIMFSIQYIVPTEAISMVVVYIVQIIIWPLSFIFPYMLYENIRSGKTYSQTQPVLAKEPIIEK